MSTSNNILPLSTSTAPELDFTELHRHFGEQLSITACRMLVRLYDAENRGVIPRKAFPNVDNHLGHMVRAFCEAAGDSPTLHIHQFEMALNRLNTPIPQGLRQTYMSHFAAARGGMTLYKFIECVIWADYLLWLYRAHAVGPAGEDRGIQLNFDKFAMLSLWFH